jgi:hypothetical protein
MLTTEARHNGVPKIMKKCVPLPYETPGNPMGNVARFPLQRQKDSVGQVWFGRVAVDVRRASEAIGRIWRVSGNRPIMGDQPPKNACLT